MWRTIKEFLPRLLWGWAGLLFSGIAAGILGWAIQLWLPSGLPEWAWWLLAISALVVASFQAYHRIRVERDGYKVPEPTTPLADVEKMVLGHENLWDVPDFLSQVRQKAHLGLITVWGRRDCIKGHEAWYVLSPIPKEYWDTYQISFMGFLDDKKGTTEPARLLHRSEEYHDLFLNYGQVIQMWPTKKRKLKFPWPIKRRMKVNSK